MLQNPIQLRLQKLSPWQQITFMACLCERMYPNYAMFCEHTEFASSTSYRQIMDTVWESLTVKNAKIDFERQLEKLEELIPSQESFDVYAVYPAIDACEALSTLLHSLLDREQLAEDLQQISTISVNTVVQLEEAQNEQEITNENQKQNEAVCAEWDVQWAIFRALKETEERDVELIRALRDELREERISNIGVSL
ncbi:YjaG family protein [Vibrio mangrovi]|uniref:DUF416 family protein n=1 Tax=Vibrio mangrovi TaxID=474394 RepID=A0A1Y6IXD9_9VIBR|nr:DUF416 family protein [Vibrio mangrovi]MDW6002155.1 DUF416 family protein [Vibrio mangrovi]SMS01500.1 hypothetical protein VIM7927_02796 [Vibrio mangrovi]